MTIRKWLWGVALLPLVCVTLVAQESKNEESAAQPTDQVPARTTEERPAPAAAQEEQPPEEEVSADNNLSFPVDI